MARCLLIAALCILVDQTLGYAHFRFDIPNGDKVPHPCNPNWIWQGVGHFSRGGGGKRNSFGEDFDANGKKWDRAICEADSDGDGKSNGEELGDPDCIWTPNAVPTRVSGLSHPGVCEPIDSPMCKGKSNFVNCTTAEFKCPAMDDPGVLKHVVNIPETPVPSKQTTYECMPVEFPTDKAYHLVAFTPHIDNINVMHHAILYGCRDTVTFDADEIGKPYHCFMGDRSGCSEFVMLWALGIDGYCLHSDAGIPIGIGGYRYAVLELHWNNPEQVSTYTDSSGLNLYLTPTLRTFNAGVLMIGELDLEIPPLEQKHTVRGHCPSKCTNQYMTGPVKIFTATNHMHYLGSGAETKLISADRKVVDLAIDDEYSYDRPALHSFEPILMNMGDELQTTCHFRTMTRDRTTFYGEETGDEMCYSFLIYYPAENIKTHSCVSYGPRAACDNIFDSINGCDFVKIFDAKNPVTMARYSNLTTNCAMHSCLKECKQVVKIINSDPCFTAENRRYLKQIAQYRGDITIETLRFWTLLESCEREIETETCQQMNYSTDLNINGAGRLAPGHVPGIWFLIGFIFILNQ